MTSFIDKTIENHNNFNELYKAYSNRLNQVSFGEKIERSFEMLIDAIEAFWEHPVLLVPIALHIIMTVLVIFLYIMPYADNLESMPENTPIYVAVVMCLCTYAIYTICSFMMLEIIQQLAARKKANIIEAIFKTLFKNLIKGAPLIIVWASISLILTSVENFLEKRIDRGGFGEKLTGTLIKVIAEIFFGMLMDFIRMVFYCIFPAIVWENCSPAKAVQKGLNVFKKTGSEILSCTLQTGFIGLFLIFLAATILVFAMLSHNINIDVHNKQALFNMVMSYLIVCIIIISVFEYIGQMFAASVYIWYKKWERECEKAKARHMPEPSLYSIRKPDLLNDVIT